MTDLSWQTSHDRPLMTQLCWQTSMTDLLWRSSHERPLMTNLLWRSSHDRVLGRSRKDEHLKKNTGFVDRGYNTSKKWLAIFFLTREKYLRYPLAWKTGKYSHFSYIFTNYGPFLNHKIMRLRQLITDTKIYIAHPKFVRLFSCLRVPRVIWYREITFFRFFHGL